MGRNGDSPVRPIRVRRRMSKFARDTARHDRSSQVLQCRARGHLPSCPGLRAAPLQGAGSGRSAGPHQLRSSRTRRWRARQRTSTSTCSPTAPVGTGSGHRTDRLRLRVHRPRTRRQRLTGTIKWIEMESGDRDRDHLVDVKTSSRRPSGSAPSERSEGVGYAPFLAPPADRAGRCRRVANAPSSNTRSAAVRGVLEVPFPDALRPARERPPDSRDARPKEASSKRRKRMQRPSKPST